MTRDKVIASTAVEGRILDEAQGRLFTSTAVLRITAARMKVAARRRIRGVGYIPFQPNTSSLRTATRVGDRHS